MLLDTFADRRNGFVFATNAAGAKADTQIANEGRDVNPNWDAVWWVDARQDGGGMDGRVPHPVQDAALSRAATRTTWGINFARRIRRKNEVSYWSPVSRAYTIYRASSDGNLAGLPPLRPGRNLRIKPFVLAGAVRGVGESALRSRSRGRRRRQGGRDAVADARRDGQPRLRAGRGRRAAGQPHAVQPVLSRRSASSSSRTPASSTSATSRATTPGRAVPSARRGPAALLQPPHRPDRQRRGGAALRRRAAHRPRRRASASA